MAGRLIAVFGAFLCLAMGGPLAAKQVELSDLWRLETAGGGQVSPDGRFIAYRRTRADPVDDRYDSDLWLMNADGSEARLLADAWDPQWLPDGRLSYFISAEGSTRRVARTISSVSDPGPETAIAVEGASLGSIVPSPDGSQIAWVSSVERTSDGWPIALPSLPVDAKRRGGAVVIDSLQYRVGVGRYRSSDSHIFIAPSTGGAARQVTSGPWSVGSQFSGISFGTSVQWDRDGKSIVFDGLPQEAGSLDEALSSRINRVDLETGQITALTEQDGFWRLPRVSPEGDMIAYVGNEASRAAFAPRQLRLMRADGSGDRVLWHDMPDRIFQMEWARDGSALYASMNHEGATELVRIGLDGSRRVVATGDFRFYLTSIADDLAVGSHTTAHSDAEIATIDLTTGELNVLTNHGAGKDELDFASVQTIWTTAADGTRVQGFLYRPADFDPEQRYPLILDIHGGPDAMAGYDFDFRYHDFAARGYMVLTSNPRGSTGYGADFANAIDGGWPGKGEQMDLEAILAAALATGSVDHDRVYVMGCSGGGSLAAWMAGRTDHFAAAAVMCPVINWISFAGSSDATSWAYTRFGRPFWEDAQNWLDHSPIMLAGEIDIPVLFAVGARDQRTPVEQAAELYTALKVRGVPTRLLVFPDEGHGPWRGIPSDLMRLQIYIDGWFRTEGNPTFQDTAP